MIKIFVAVGTQKFPFNRLINAMDTLSMDSDKYLITGQIGNAEYMPHNYMYKRFMAKDEFERAINQNDIIITHGGVGTIIQALKMEKHVVVVPRLKKYGEHIDNHQIQIAESFSSQSFVVMYKDGESDFENCIIEASRLQPRKYISNHEYFINVVDRFIRNQEKTR